MKKTIRILSLFITVFLLTGCLGISNNNSNKPPTGFHSYENAEIKINVPDDWETLTKNDFKPGTPENTITAFKNNIKDSVFTANITIIKNELTADISSSDYGKALYQKIKKELLSYKENRVENTAAIFIDVEGRTSTQGDLKRFIQTSQVKGKTAYIVTGSCLSPADEGLIEKIEASVRSFEVK